MLKPAPFVFTVAGTNGKGTTCRTLESVLMAAGYKVGVYSSPHLVRYTERVRVQNTELAESAHTASFAAIEAARGETSLTYFEYGTLSALWLFKQAQLDVVIWKWGWAGVWMPPIWWMRMSPSSPASRWITPTGWARTARALAVRGRYFPGQ